MSVDFPLFLSAADVRRVLPMSDAIAAMRDAFSQLSSGQATLPARQHLPAPHEHGVALVMPCISSALNLFSLKVVTVFHGNTERGLPIVQSLIMLTDGSTGTPLAVMDGASLTAIRTGAATGVATDLLARADATSVAILGAGVQAGPQLEAVCAVRPIRRARVFARNPQSTARFADEMAQRFNVTVEAVGSAANAVQDADIVCAATSSATPVLDDSDVSEGSHINAIGSYRPDMVEIPAATVCRARVVVDHRESVRAEAGDLLAPLHEGLISESHFQTELGDIVLGRAKGRSHPKEITLFKSVGVAIQDLCAAACALQNARRLGIGTVLGTASPGK